MVQPLPNEMMAETGDVGNQCVTIVTDAINCDPQMLGPRTDETDPDDSGNQKMLQEMNIIIIILLPCCLEMENHADNFILLMQKQEELDKNLKVNLSYSHKGFIL